MEEVLLDLGMSRLPVLEASPKGIDLCANEKI